MNPDTDYYRTLGVLDDAEDVVIRAAYRALAQRYHPDKWQGDPAEATRRMVEINAAYAVLSDTEKRAAYDATRDKNQFQDEPPEAEDANEARMSSLRAEAAVEAARVARMRSFFSFAEAKPERVIWKSPAERRREVGSLWLSLLLWLVVFGGGETLLELYSCGPRLKETGKFCDVLMPIMVMGFVFSIPLALAAVYKTIAKLPAFFNRESDFNFKKISFTFTLVFLFSLSLLGYFLIDFYHPDFVIKDFVKWLLIRYMGSVF